MPTPLKTIKRLLDVSSSVRADQTLTRDQKRTMDNEFSTLLSRAAERIAERYQSAPEQVQKAERDAYELIRGQPVTHLMGVSHLQDKHGLTTMHRARPETRLVVKAIVQPEVSRRVLDTYDENHDIQPEREALRMSIGDPNRRAQLDRHTRGLCPSCQNVVSADFVRIMMDMFRVEVFEQWVRVREEMKQGVLTQEDSERIGQLISDRAKQVLDWIKSTSRDQIQQAWIPLTHTVFKFIVQIVDEVNRSIWTARMMLQKADPPGVWVDTIDTALNELNQLERRNPALSIFKYY
jgi:hypothetical protein